AGSCSGRFVPSRGEVRQGLLDDVVGRGQRYAEPAWSPHDAAWQDEQAIVGEPLNECPVVLLWGAHEQVESSLAGLQFVIKGAEAVDHDVPTSLDGPEIDGQAVERGQRVL